MESEVGVVVVGVVEYSWFRKICTARGLSVRQETQIINTIHTHTLLMYIQYSYTLLWHGYHYTSLTVLCVAVAGM